jgi:hypothetical protein
VGTWHDEDGDAKTWQDEDEDREAGNQRWQRELDSIVKYTRHCVKKKEKENGSWGIESPYIHNSFFTPRD